MDLAYYKERIEELIRDYLQANNLILVELKLFFHSGKLDIRFLVDCEDGGITLDKCAEINRDFGKILDNANLIAESYILDISSPGIDRWLRKESDFRRVKGKDLDLFLLRPLNGKLQLSAKLVEVDSEGVYLEVENQKLKIKYQDISKAKQKI